MVYAWGTCTLTLIPRGGGDPIFIDAKFLTICEKQRGGSLKIRCDVFNSNVQPGQRLTRAEGAVAPQKGRTRPDARCAPAKPMATDPQYFDRLRRR